MVEKSDLVAAYIRIGENAPTYIQQQNALRGICRKCGLHISLIYRDNDNDDVAFRQLLSDSQKNPCWDRVLMWSRAVWPDRWHGEAFICALKGLKFQFLSQH